MNHIKHLLLAALFLTACFAAPAQCLIVTCAATNKTVACGSNWTFDPPTIANCVDCGGVNYTLTVTTVTNGNCPQVITMTWKVVNTCHNTNQCSQTVTVLNTNQPVFQGVSNRVVYACSGVPVFFNVTATEACCGSVGVVCTPASGSFFLPGVTTVNCVATDCCGRSYTNHISVDVVAPTLQLNCSNKTVACGTAWSFDPPAVLDSTNYTVFGLTPVTNGSCPQVISKQWQVTDVCGNSNRCTEVVTVVNTNRPVFQGVNNLVFNSCSSTPVFFNVLATTPCCGSVSIVYTPPSGTILSPGTTTNVHCVATDCCGNTAGTNFLITVAAPSLGLNCAPFNTLPCGTPLTFDLPGIVPGCCSNTNYSLSALPLFTNSTSPLNVTKTWVITNSCGESNFCSQTVTVYSPPVFTNCADLTIECGDPLPDPPGVMNLCCANVTVSLIDAQTNTTSQGCPLSIFQIWQVTDCYGYNYTCTRTVTVQSSPPVVGCPTNKTVVGSFCLPGYDWTFDPPTVLSSCCGTNFTITELCTTTNMVNCANTANCGSNNQTNGTAHLSLFDGINPIIEVHDNNPDPILHVILPDFNPSLGVISTTTNYLYAIGVWNPIVVTAKTKPASGCMTNPMMDLHIETHSFAAGTLTITFSDKDFGPTSDTFTGAASGQATNNGSATTLTYNVYADPGNVVGYTYGPSAVLIASTGTLPMSVCPAVVSGPLALSAPYSLTQVATIQSSGPNSFIVDVSFALPVPAVTGPAIITRIWQVTDCCGNSTNCSQTVTVVPPPPVFQCPSNIVVQAVNTSQVQVNFDVTVTDACDGTTVVCNPPSGSLFPIGTNTVTCYAVNGCSNQSAPCSFQVVVQPVLNITCGSSLYALSQDNTGYTTLNTISPSGSGATPLFGVGANFDALAYAAPDLGYGPDLFYALSNDASGFSSFYTISPGGAIMKQFDVGTGFDALTFAEPDLGYGPNLFYAIWNDPGGNSVLYTISAGGIVQPRFNLGTGFRALTFAAPDLGYGSNLLYAIATDNFSDASTFYTISTSGAVIAIGGLGAQLGFDGLAFALEDLSYGPNLFYSIFHDVSGTWFLSSGSSSGPGNLQFSLGSFGYGFGRLACRPSAPSANASSNTVFCGTPWSFVPPVVQDSCCASFNYTLTALPPVTNGTCTQVISQTFLVSDACGNSNQYTETMTVVTAPPAIACPANFVVTTCDTNVLVTWPNPTATGACSSVTVISTPPSGTFFLPNTTNTVVCTATDGCDNNSTCTFTVTVLRPIIGNPAITMSGGIVTVSWSDGILEQADSLFGPWTDVPGAASPYHTNATAQQTFYRLRCNSP